DEVVCCYHLLQQRHSTSRIRRSFMARHWQFARPAFSSLALVIGLFAATAQAADPTVLQVNAFPNAKALPLHAGIAKGIFERRGLRIELELTEGSRAQRDGLASGKFHIAHSALDNAVAMIEGPKVDVVIVSGGDSGMNEFY